MYSMPNKALKPDCETEYFPFRTERIGLRAHTFSRLTPSRFPTPQKYQEVTEIPESEMNGSLPQSERPTETQ